jgi:septal ring factor EnvC (AmiA/AmiB activator)
MDEFEKLRQELTDARAEIADLRRELIEVKARNNELSWQVGNSRDAQEFYDRERW